MTWGKQPASRSTIHWVLASTTLVLLPHMLHMPAWISIAIAVMLAWRFVIIRSEYELPGQILINAIMLSMTFGVYLDFGSVFGRNPGVALMVSMLSLKMLELRTKRDVMVAITLGYFVVLTHFLFNQSILTGLYMLASALAITATLIDVNGLPGKSMSVRRLFELSTRIFIQALPLMLVFFILFPRVNGPLWGLPDDAYTGSSGLSNSMAPGSINQLNQSTAIAFRVEFNGAVPDKKNLYWRGPVFWNFDGVKWTAGRGGELLLGANLRPIDSQVSYTITLEAHNQSWLLMLDTPLSARIEENPGFVHRYNFTDTGTHRDGSRITADLKLELAKPLTRRMRYQGVSVFQKQQTHLSKLARWYALRYPENLQPDIIKLAQSWREKNPDARAIAAQALHYFNTEPFVYTLQPGVLGDHPTARFLFETRRGYCEHYASAFTLLMRAAGVPARVVTGYLGGEINPLDNYLIVRQSDAHAWSEIWVDGAGWQRVDPTAAVAPERIEKGATAIPGLDIAPVLIRQNNALSQLWRKLRFGVDMLNNKWNIWIIAYGPSLQQEVLSVFGLATTQRMLFALLTFVALLIGFYAWRMFALHTQYSDSVVLTYAKFCRKLARRGILRHSYEGPQDFAQRITLARPELAAQVEAITRLYTALRYGRYYKGQWLTDLKKRVREFSP